MSFALNPREFQDPPDSQREGFLFAREPEMAAQRTSSEIKSPSDPVLAL